MIWICQHYQPASLGTVSACEAVAKAAIAIKNMLCVYAVRLARIMKLKLAWAS